MTKDKEIKTYKMTITMTRQQQQRAREISTELLGKSNISGLFAYFIDNYCKVNYPLTEDGVGLNCEVQRKS